jgi:DNA-binding transcriptional ArsR family regulator
MPGKIKNEKRDKKVERMARISSAFKALSNETRLAVFENIRLCQKQAILNKTERPSVCNVASNFNISLSTISHHMKELRNAGLIRCEKRGQSIL